jgi:hypothetical protein
MAAPPVSTTTRLLHQVNSANRVSPITSQVDTRKQATEAQLLRAITKRGTGAVAATTNMRHHPSREATAEDRDMANKPVMGVPAMHHNINSPTVAPLVTMLRMADRKTTTSTSIISMVVQDSSTRRPRRATDSTRATGARSHRNLDGKRMYLLVASGLKTW